MLLTSWKSLRSAVWRAVNLLTGETCSKKIFSKNMVKNFLGKVSLDKYFQLLCVQHFLMFWYHHIMLLHCSTTTGKFPPPQFVKGKYACLRKPPQTPPGPAAKNRTQKCRLFHSPHVPRLFYAAILRNKNKIFVVF